ncbi:MAG: heme o synthase [Vicinamibacterales bacterium]|nr:heme o synthase [Vicinamibacterales bacterium]
MKKGSGALLDAPFPAAAAPSRVADFVALTKPRLNFLVVVTAAVGYYLGAGDHLQAMKLIESIVGTALVAGGAAGLNQVYERNTDNLMWRTRNRPLAAQRLTPNEATIFSLVIAGAGLGLLALNANLLAASLALLTLISYNVVYTPMKRHSQLATLVGAIPGALPPMIGWTAAQGRLTPEAWALFAIVFVWQIPHFMAIAWLYRDDFGRAGFPLLPVVSPDGVSTARQAVIFAALLIPVSLLPFQLRAAGAVYAAGALVGSLAILGLSLSFAAQRTNDRARRLFVGSITYLPLLWMLLIADAR